MEKYTWIVNSFLTCICVLPGVMGLNETDEISGLIAAAVVGFFLFIVIIVIVTLGLTWDSWFPKIQRWRGKIKIPKHIIALRKKLAEKVASDKSTLVAGGDARIPDDSKSWVEGWHANGTTISQREYETKDVTMNLGEEKPDDENYRIEAEIVDNEALDLGPYKKMSNNTVVDMSGAESPLYSVVDKPSMKSNGAAKHFDHFEETATSFSAMMSDPSVVNDTPMYVTTPEDEEEFRIEGRFIDEHSTSVPSVDSRIHQYPKNDTPMYVTTPEDEEEFQIKGRFMDEHSTSEHGGFMETLQTAETTDAVTVASPNEPTLLNATKPLKSTVTFDTTNERNVAMNSDVDIEEDKYQNVDTGGIFGLLY